ncbi:ABC-2 type transport system ATP-binding protein [Ereboglobus sp. PH5-10]|uniref:ABC transporter ATP-binding protein n=1 Tax=Ereboglobus sp. PH5-10 TaxID=2940629 RepID=UPI002405AE0E|nr:ABC transporter ATP-binding protein [Ereboglobus sp. PH5-10]MDF9826446.1 ABC-2 type transport system ATP-binding protein [Ereboglobus sp. PH5-10]
MSDPIVKVRGLERAFGRVRAVDGISFDLARGQVVGLIGANGAGKTTAMRIMATLDMPDSGAVTIGGVDIVDYPTRVRRHIGWMPDHITPYSDTTVGDYLDFFGRAHGFAGAELARRVDEVRDFTDLVSLNDRPTTGLSKGQSQRLCLARTLLNNPEFLILDEPAAGLDPKARLEFKNLVRVLRERGKTLLISSHILSELGEMCDSLIFMDAGRLVHHGDTDSLQRRDARTGIVFEIETLGPAAALLDWLAVRPGWRVVEQLRDGARAEFASGEPGAVAAELRRMSADLQIVEFRRQERRLEEAFVEMLRAGNGAPPPLPFAGNGGDAQ